MPIIFDKKKKMGAVASAAPDGRLESGPDAALKLLAGDIRAAVSEGSDESLMKALKAFFLQCDSEPDEEG